MPNLVYFPDSGVAEKGGLHSPVTQPVAQHGPPNVQLFQRSPNKQEQSLEQGFGRSPGQQWPHMPHVEQYSFDSLANLHQLDGELGPDGFERLERAGWSAPLFWQQYYSHHLWPDPISTADPTHVPYTELAEVPQ